MQKFLLCALVGSVNLTLNKPAADSHPADDILYPASKAVNGVYDELGKSRQKIVCIKKPLLSFLCKKCLTCLQIL